MPKTYFLIGSYYGGHTFEALLNHLANLTPPHDHCVLINRQYTEKSMMGFAKVYNGLVQAALHDRECEVIWLLGDDVLPQGHCIEETQSNLDYGVGAVFPVEAWRADGKVVSLAPFTGQELLIPRDLERRCVEQVYAGFACVCTRRQVWSEIGLLDEYLGRGYGEDLDWGIRTWQEGWACINYRGAWFLHDRGGTYNKLVADGVYLSSEPYDAADRVKAKYPGLGLYERPGQDIVKDLRKYYVERWA